MPGIQMTEPASFNAMLKRREFWRHMPHEPLLIIQTDALLGRPLDPFFFQFPYLGAPFLPRTTQRVLREAPKATGASAASSKPTLPSMDRPIQMYIPIFMATAGCQFASAR